MTDTSNRQINELISTLVDPWTHGPVSDPGHRWKGIGKTMRISKTIKPDTPEGLFWIPFDDFAMGIQHYEYVAGAGYIFKENISLDYGAGNDFKTMRFVSGGVQLTGGSVGPNKLSMNGTACAINVADVPAFSELTPSTVMSFAQDENSVGLTRLDDGVVVTSRPLRTEFKPVRMLGDRSWCSDQRFAENHRIPLDFSNDATFRPKIDFPRGINHHLEFSMSGKFLYPGPVGAPSSHRVEIEFTWQGAREPGHPTGGSRKFEFNIVGIAGAEHTFHIGPIDFEFPGELNFIQVKHQSPDMGSHLVGNLRIKDYASMTPGQYTGHIIAYNGVDSDMSMILDGVWNYEAIPRFHLAPNVRQSTLKTVTSEDKEAAEFFVRQGHRIGLGGTYRLSSFLHLRESGQLRSVAINENVVALAADMGQMLDSAWKFSKPILRTVLPSLISGGGALLNAATGAPVAPLANFLATATRSALASDTLYSASDGSVDQQSLMATMLAALTEEQRLALFRQFMPEQVAARRRKTVTTSTIDVNSVPGYKALKMSGDPQAHAKHSYLNGEPDKLSAQFRNRNLVFATTKFPVVMARGEQRSGTRAGMLLTTSPLSIGGGLLDYSKVYDLDGVSVHVSGNLQDPNDAPQSNIFERMLDQSPFLEAVRDLRHGDVYISTDFAHPVQGYSWALAALAAAHFCDSSVLYTGTINPPLTELDVKAEYAKSNGQKLVVAFTVSAHTREEYDGARALMKTLEDYGVHAPPKVAPKDHVVVGAVGLAANAFSLLCALMQTRMAVPVQGTPERKKVNLMYLGRPVSILGDKVERLIELMEEDMSENGDSYILEFDQSGKSAGAKEAFSRTVKARKTPSNLLAAYTSMKGAGVEVVGDELYEMLDEIERGRVRRRATRPQRAASQRRPPAASPQPPREEPSPDDVEETLDDYWEM